MKILIAYYSRYGHTYKLARAVEEGVNSVAGAQAILRRAEEFPDAMAEIAKSEHSMKAWEEQQSVPVCSLDDLRSAKGALFGSPTRFGNMCAQMKRLFDSMGGLWGKGEMEGKPAGVFTSTASTHGGQETTCLTMMVPMIHLGMLIVGVPYSTPGMLHQEGRGGTPYGASVTAGGKGELAPKPEDLEIARALGRRVAETAKRLFA